MKNIRIFDDPRAAIADLAEQWWHWSEQAIARHTLFHVALAGGSTPRALYELLAAPPYRDRLPWQQHRFFFGDERCVAADHADSNQRMARLALLNHVPVDATQIFAMGGDSIDLEAAASDYEARLRAMVPAVAGLPRFDLVLLGMGDDGHTASLFPETTALQEQSRLVVPVYVKKFDSWRLTCTYPLLNNAARIVLLVTGAGKAEMVAQILEGDGGRYPVQAIRPAGELYWYLDREAASAL